MSDHALAGVRAIVARNDALARDTVGVLCGGLEGMQARGGGLGDSNRWHAITTLLEDEGRKLMRSTADNVHRLDASVEAFAIIESAFREFLQFLEVKYFAIAGKGQAFGGSRPDPENKSNPLSAHWWKAKERLELEIEASRAIFSQPSIPGPTTAPAVDRNKGGKPVAAHWDAMWAHIAVRLYTLDLQPESQADIEKAMLDWLERKSLNGGPTAVRQRARALWQQYQPVKQ